MNVKKKAGTWAETAVKNQLAITFPGCKRLAPAGAVDCGDLDGLPHMCVQVKNHQRLALAAWMDEAKKQAANAGRPWYVVIHRRRQKAAGQWYVTMTLDQFAEIYRAAIAIPVDR